MTNPLCGSQGATYIYGPQKGVTPDMLPILDAGMKNYAEVTAKVTGKDNQNAAGAGAAGGLGFAFLNYLDGELTAVCSDGDTLRSYLESLLAPLRGSGRREYQRGL